MIYVIQAVLNRWHQATSVCIQALTLAAYEIGLSLSKYLPSIFVRLSQSITSPAFSVIILEFMFNIVRLPDLWLNFTESDFRRAFGVTLQYIQHAKVGAEGHFAHDVKSETSAISIECLSTMGELRTRRNSSTVRYQSSQTSVGQGRPSSLALWHELCPRNSSARHCSCLCSKFVCERGVLPGPQH